MGWGDVYKYGYKWETKTERKKNKTNKKTIITKHKTPMINSRVCVCTQARVCHRMQLRAEMGDSNNTTLIPATGM